MGAPASAEAIPSGEAATRRWSGDALGGGTGAVLFGLLSFLPVAVVLSGWLYRAYLDGPEVLAWALPSGRTLRLLGNSLLLSTAVAALAGAIGTGMAIWIHQGDSWWHRLARRAYLVPLLIPPYIHALAWLSVGGRRQALEQLLAVLLGPNRVTLSGYGFWPTALVMALALAPIVTLLVLAGLEAVEPELIEQASLLRPPWPTARHVLLPLLAPSMVAGVGLVFVLAMLDYGVPSVLQFNVYVMETYASFSQDNDPLRAGATSLVLMVAAMLLLALSQGRLRSNPLRGIPGRRAPLPVAGGPRIASWALEASVLATALAIIGPITVLLLRGGALAILVDSISMAFREIGLTLGLAVVSASLSTLVAVPLAGLLLKPGRRGVPGWLLCALPLAVPAPLTGIGLIYLGNTPWLDWAQGTPLPLVWAHTARLMPFAVFAASTQVRRIDPLLVEAASLHDVGRWRRLAAVRLPLLVPAIVISWLVVFVLSLGELGASLMVAPPGQATLPMRIYNLLHYGASEQVAALSLLMLGIAGVTGAALLAWGGWLWRWRT